MFAKRQKKKNAGRVSGAQGTNRVLGNDIEKGKNESSSFSLGIMPSMELNESPTF
jgi:hypothetical protein